MKTKKVALFAASVTALIPFSSAFALEVALEGAEPGEWTMDHNAALELASEKDLPLLLNFTGSDWCGWCKLMDKQVFSEAEWEDWAQDNLVLVTIDFPRDESIVPTAFKGRNNLLSQQFGVKGYPTYILLDSDGETVIHQLGAGRDKTPESFIGEIETALMMNPASLEAKVEELGAAPREFESSDGRSIKAEVLDLQEDLQGNLVVKLQRSDLRLYTIPVSRFSPADREYFQGLWEKKKLEETLLVADDRFDLNLKLNKKTEDKDDKWGGRYRDRKYRYEPEAVIKNEEFAQGFEGNTVRVVVIAESKHDKGEYLVVSAITEKVDFEPKETVSVLLDPFFLTEREYNSSYDSSYDYEYGYGRAVKSQRMIKNERV